MKFSSETFQHLLYFYNKLFLFLFQATFDFTKIVKFLKKKHYLCVFLFQKHGIFWSVSGDTNFINYDLQKKFFTNLTCT